MSLMLLTATALTLLCGCAYLSYANHKHKRRLIETQRNLLQHQDLLTTFGVANQHAASGTPPAQTFEKLLKQVLEIADSEFGFIGEVDLIKKQPVLFIHAVHHQRWGEDARQAFSENIERGLYCSDMDTLYGQVLTSGQAIVINTQTPAPCPDDLAIDLPPLDNFLGLPIHYGDKLIGVLGIANRKAGYDQSLVKQLTPFTSTYGNLISTYQISAELLATKQENQQARQTLQTVLDAIPTQVFWKDKNSVYQGCNRSFAIDAGLKNSEQIIGLKDNDLIWHQDASRLQAEDQTIIGGGPPKLSAIERHIEPDGSITWLESNKIPMRTKSGKTIGVIGVYSDISERRAHEAELQRLTSTLNETMDSVFMFEADSLLFFYVNKGAAKQVGYSNEQLMHMTPVDIKPDYDRASFEEIIAPMIAGEYKSFTFTTRHQHQSGRIIPVEIFLQYVTTNVEHPCFIAITHDISARLRAEAVLKNSEARQRAIVDNVVDGIITINRHGTIETFNQSAERIFGYLPEEVIGKNVNTLIPEPHHSNHDSYLSNYLNTGVRRIIGIGREVEGLRKDGSTFPVDLAVSEMIIDGERMFTGVVRDITERKRIEKLKNEFISTVSHELRTPLTSIRGSLGLLSSGTMGELPEKASGMLSIASSNTERLLLLINDILDIQKIESGNMNFKFQPLSIASFLEQSLESNAGYALQFQVKLRTENHIGDAYIYADQARLMQVMHNLLSNAIKFSPANATVEITAARHHNNVRISVSDHGTGISNDFRGKIFQKFSQSDGSDTRQVGGTGLGLTICRTIIDKHAGHIDYISAPDVGSTFFFDIAEHHPVDAPLAKKAAAASPNSNVLLFAENYSSSTLISKLLLAAGHESDIHEESYSAIRMLTHYPGNYKSVIIETSPYNSKNTNILRDIRASIATTRIPLTLISLLPGNESDTTTGGAATILDWINKPIDEERLTRATQILQAHTVKPKLLLIEQDNDIYQIVRTLLSDTCHTEHAIDIKTAHSLLTKNTYDAAFLDMGFGSDSGLELIQEICKLKHPPKLILCSTPESEPAYTEELIIQLKQAHTDKTQLSNVILQALSPSNG